MNYSIFILRRAQRELAQVPEKTFERITKAIKSLENNPRPKDSKKLSGRSGWRIRVGAYRVIYEINDQEKEITILHIGHRRDVYR